MIDSSTAPADVEAGQAVPADAEALWEKTIERVAREKPSLGALLKRCHIQCPSPTQLTVEVDGNEFAVNSIQKHRTFLEQQLSRLAGKTLVLEVVANTRDAGEKQKEKEEADRHKQNALGHPMVMEALALFEGKVVDVKLT
jgi:DNA polymerase-3 subunit gamma/tau